MALAFAVMASPTTRTMSLPLDLISTPSAMGVISPLPNGCTFVRFLLARTGAHHTNPFFFL
jgi:hypothetical protein